MSRSASNPTHTLLWRLAVLASHAFWACVLGTVLVLSPAWAETSTTTTTTSVTVGADSWRLHGGPARYLPDYNPPRDWHNTSAWTRLHIQHTTDTPAGTLTLTGQARADQVGGNRIDRLDADLRITDQTGLRLGMLPYRISWCRTMDDRSPWIAEPDAFCRFSGLNEISQGAAGAQAYHSTVAGPWLIDGMAGVYRPLLDGQNDKLGPYVSVGPTAKHTAHGASVNALHLPTGIQTRAGWLRTQQHQDSTDPKSYQRRLQYDSYYLAAEGNVTQGLDLRASLAGYLGEQLNPVQPYRWDGRSLTAEASYQLAPGHGIALGWSRYTNRTTYAKAPNHQRLQVTSRSVAWRFDLPDGWWGVLQAGNTVDDNTTRQGKQTLREGTAYGLRLAKTF